MTALIRFFALILTLTATAAAAQLHQTDQTKKTFVCIDKSDAYKLALADMLGTLGSLSLPSKFTEEGRCAWLPAVYLFTIDRYVDSIGEPSQVVEMTIYGKRVWGLFGSVTPDGVWLISYH